MKRIVIDSGFLIALERRSDKSLAFAKRIHSGVVAAHVPAGVIAQVWRGQPK